MFTVADCDNHALKVNIGDHGSAGLHDRSYLASADDPSPLIHHTGGRFMNGVAGVLLTIGLAVLTGVVIGLVTGILVWIKDSRLQVSERVADAVLRGGAACAATILLMLAVFAAAGVLH
jgi:hypothetical protein